MIVFRKMINDVVRPRLVVHIIVEVSHTPKDGLVPHILGQLQNLLTVLTARRSEIHIHIVTSFTLHKIRTFLKLTFLLLHTLLRHARMMHRVVSYLMPLLLHSLYYVRVIPYVRHRHKETALCIVFLQNVKHLLRISILISAVKCEIHHLFSLFCTGSVHIISIILIQRETVIASTHTVILVPDYVP